jgi:NitT/TauT family transport system substrate-binding protein
MTQYAIRLVVAAALLLGAGGCHARRAPAADGLRLGFFPNLTHAAALVGLERGTFAAALAPVAVDPRPFNAGPAAMEALFAGAIDAAYVGPAPAINGYLRSHGEALEIVAGAAEGGAGLVVRNDAGIHGAADLHGKKLATPQLGNTQDVALRTYLRNAGLRSTDRGGDVLVLPLNNADILTLMKRKELDGAWVPEPWLTRLLDEAHGTLLVDEADLWPQHRFPATVLVVTRKLADERPELVHKLVAAHAATVRWIDAHPEETLHLVDAGLRKWGKKKLPMTLLTRAFRRVHVTDRIDEPALRKQAADARALGFLPPGDLGGLVERRFLDRVAAP